MAKAVTCSCVKWEQVKLPVPHRVVNTKQYRLLGDMKIIVIIKALEEVK
jgi:hypothetical protein